MFARLLTVLLFLSPTEAFASTVKVAVLEFANSSASSEWAPLGKGLQEMFLVDLDKAEAIDVVPRSDLRERQLALNLVPPGEAAIRQRLARESGATHLLSGSFRVDGVAMELRVELLDATSGKVVLADQKTGEAEAFFELQKSALQASMGALKLSLTPKERAETGRVHTADFKAFQDFSRGLDHFDAARYEASLESLRAAAERDTEFGLAKLTLAQYEELIANTRGKAEAVRTVRAEQERLEKLQAAGEEVEVARRLLEYAALEGAANQRKRLTAMHILAVSYQGSGSVGNRPYLLLRLEDRFLLARNADQLAALYHREAMSLWPRLPAQVDDNRFGGFPKLATFDKDFAWNEKKLWDDGLDYPENRKNYLLNSLRYGRNVASSLHLSLVDEVRLQERFRKMAVELGAEGYHLEEQDETLLLGYRKALMLDEATRLLDRQARVTENEWALKGLAEQMEDNKILASFLEKAASPIAREYAMLALDDGWQLEQTARFGESSLLTVGKLSPRGAAQLTRFRKLSDRTYLLLGQTPLWLHQPAFWLWSGPRTDARVASSLRYNKDNGSKDLIDALLFVGPGPVADVTVRWTLSFQVPDDFWPGSETERRVATGRPAVGLLVGATDVDVAKVRDPVTEKDVLARPLHALAVRVAGDELQIVRVVESERGMWDRKQSFSEQVLATRPLKKGLTTLPIEVTVRDRTVRAAAAGVTVEAKVDEPVRGFVGFQIRGEGFAEIGSLGFEGATTGPY
jgi:TolB-like protein